MSSKERNKKSGMSMRTKWAITIALCILAVITVILCALGGNFSFKAGSVQSHDEPVAETKAPEQNLGDKSSSDSEHTIFITASNGGSADPTGSVTVETWGSVTINFTPDKGHELQSLTVDGKEKDVFESYTLSYITEDHSIVATFGKISEPKNTDKPVILNDNGEADD